MILSRIWSYLNQIIDWVEKHPAISTIVAGLFALLPQILAFIFNQINQSGELQRQKKKRLDLKQHMELSLKNYTLSFGKIYSNYLEERSKLVELSNQKLKSSQYGGDFSIDRKESYKNIELSAYELKSLLHFDFYDIYGIEGFKKLESIRQLISEIEDCNIQIAKYKDSSDKNSDVERILNSINFLIKNI
jgi:hypothetical protein